MDFVCGCQRCRVGILNINSNIAMLSKTKWTIENFVLHVKEKKKKICTNPNIEIYPNLCQSMSYPNGPKSRKGSVQFYVRLGEEFFIEYKLRFFFFFSFEVTNYKKMTKYKYKESGCWRSELYEIIHQKKRIVWNEALPESPIKKKKKRKLFQNRILCVDSNVAMLEK